jgi:hypothetical protein
MQGRSLVVAAMVVLGACSGGEAGTTTTDVAEPSTAPASTTTVVTTTTAATTTAPSTTVPAPTTTAAPATTTTTDTNALASGSGCTPGSDDLPDGEWFGYVIGADGDTIDFDLACWFSGDAADLAAAEDGEESPAPNGYYIRNVNPQVRTVEVSPTVEVLAMANIGDPATEGPMAFDDWVALRVADAEVPMDVWIVIEDDLVVSITEQYRP